MPAVTKATSAEHFLKNVFWSWLGVLFSIASSLLLSPFIIHRLGDERYGIWVLVYSMVEYYGLVDFGFRSAVCKYAAHFRATGEIRQLEEVVATALFYFSGAGVIIIAGSIVLAWLSSRFFPISPQNLPAFRFLIILTGVIEGLGVLANTCTAVIEAYQRFDITNRIFVTANAVRVLGSFTVIYFGFGLRPLGGCVLFGQLLGYALTYRAMRRLLPGCSFSFRRATRAMARQLFGYGRHTFMANISLMVLNQDAPILIGHYLSAAFAGYFVYSLRLVTYSVELVGRLGLVTGSKTAELCAHGDRAGIARMAVLVNRYSLLLFLPIAAYLSIFGRQLLTVWINPSFASHGAPLIPILGAGIVIAVAAAYNSISILYGLGLHSSLARAVFVEAIASVVGLIYVIPRYGLIGAAWVVAGLLILSRGIVVQWAVSRHIGMRFTEYLGSIYRGPLLVATPVVGLTWLVNHALSAPATWPVVLGGGAVMAVCYYGIAFFFALDPNHRSLILSICQQRLPFPIKARVTEAG